MENDCSFTKIFWYMDNKKKSGQNKKKKKSPEYILNFTWEKKKTFLFMIVHFSTLVFTFSLFIFPLIIKAKSVLFLTKIPDYYYCLLWFFYELHWTFNFNINFYFNLNFSLSFRFNFLTLQPFPYKEMKVVLILA